MITVLLQLAAAAFAFYYYLFPHSEKEESAKHQGGLSDVCPKIVAKYIKNVQKIRINFKWNKSVEKLAKTINQDPVLKYNWEHGISRTENLSGYSGKDVLDMVNAVLNVGPAFDTSGLVGFPINVLFIHLMQNENGRAIFANPNFNSALKAVLNDYGAMLTSETSLTYMHAQTSKGWFSADAQAGVDYSEFQCDPSLPHYGFKNWHEWFLRQFKAGKREIGAGSPVEASPSDIVINSCESTPIIRPRQPTKQVKSSSSFWLKDSQYSLSDMFGQHGIKHDYGGLFVEGTVFQSFLSALAYHHWHAPVSGKVVDVYKIPGTYFLDQSQHLNEFDPNSPDLSQSFISHTAARMVIIIKADNPKLGHIGLVYIGMAECSGVESSKKKGDRVEKGDHIGNFVFGGSSYVMLFQKDAELTFSDELYSESREGETVQHQQKVLSFLAQVK